MSWDGRPMRPSSSCTTTSLPSLIHCVSALELLRRFWGAWWKVLEGLHSGKDRKCILLSQCWPCGLWEGRSRGPRPSKQQRAGLQGGLEQVSASQPGLMWEGRVWLCM